MIIQSLKLENFRHLANQSYDFDSQFNLIVGKNASGKTSLLEAIYFLSHTRSFRTSRVNQIIADGEAFFRLFSTLVAPGGSDEIGGIDEGAERAKASPTFRHTSQLGIERDRQEIRVRQDYETVTRRSHLAKLLPILFLGPDTGQLLVESPKFRRQFVDWGLFQNHEEYHRLWLRYERALSQRNAALKQHYPDAVLAGLEEEMAHSGERVNSYRTQFLEHLFTPLEPLLKRLLGEEIAWTLDYHAGFTPGQLKEELIEARPRDRILTYTRKGPHRGDFTLKSDGKAVGQHLSRGQIKLATIAMMLAQIRLHREASGQSTILLMDDLTAELDQEKRAILLEELIAQKSQLFVTCLEESEFPELANHAVKSTMSYYQLSDGKAQKMV